MQETDRGNRRGMMVMITQNKNSSNKTVSLEDAMSLLAQGFLRGGVSSFLKGTGELMKGSVVSQELRVGVAHAYAAMLKTLGPNWLERNLQAVLVHVLELAANPKAAPSHTDAVCSRNCVSYILSSVLGRMLREKCQISVCKELIGIISKSHTPETSSELSPDTNYHQHLLVVAHLELGSLLQVIQC